MKLNYSNIQVKKAAEFISQNNKYINYSSEYLEEKILDMIRNDFEHIQCLGLDEYVNGTMGFLYHITRGSEEYSVDIYVNPSVSSSSYEWKSL